MGEAKRIAEAEEQYRNKKISFIREYAPQFITAVMMAGNSRANANEYIEFTADFFDAIEKKAKQIALGEKND